MSQSKSRRRFLLASTGITVVGAMQVSILALAQEKKFTRHSVATAQGKKMLEIYARGVALLMDETKFPQSDPRSWLFQWYTHSVRSDLDKAQELKRIFKSAGPGQTLAPRCGIPVRLTQTPQGRISSCRGTEHMSPTSRKLFERSQVRQVSHCLTGTTLM